MNGQKHIIFKEVLELTVPDRGRAISIQNQTSEIVKQKLNPELNRVFSKLARPGETIRIDKLILELGPVNEKDLENMLVEKTIQLAGDKIASLINENRILTEVKTAGSCIPATNNNIKVVSKPEDTLDRFIFFLRTGHLPWWQTRNDEENISDIFEEILKYDANGLKNLIAPALREPEVRKRLIFQFDEKQWIALLQRIDEQRFRLSRILFEEFISCTGSSMTADNLKESYYEVVFRHFSRDEEIVTEEQQTRFVSAVLELSLAGHTSGEKEKILVDILHAALLKLTTNAKDDAKHVASAAFRAVAGLSANRKAISKLINKLPLKVRHLLKEMAKQSDRELPSVSGVAAEIAEQHRKRNKTPEEGTQKTIHGKDTEMTKEETISLFRAKSLPGAEEIYIYNAGLVLLHPFLRYFFEGLGLLDEELRFKSPDVAFKAVHLLQFVATGQENAAEYDLTLNKVFCGLEATEPVPKSLPLSDKEKQECIHLIKTVLDRWKSLKTKNPDALRQTYLRREGIMKQAGQGWNITVERNTFDVMLEKLPWAISIIRFPWSPQILYVEW